MLYRCHLKRTLPPICVCIAILLIMAIPVFKNSDQYSTLNVNKSDIRIETVTRITKILQSTVQDTRHVHSLMNPVPTLEEQYIVLINNTTKRRQKMYDHPYKYLKTPLGTCQLDGARSDPFMLIIIKSNVKNLDHRMAIRQTWANISDSSVKVIFTLGYSPFLQEYINKESSMFHDILQENFIDDYNNNTLKTVMAFNWCVTKCSKTKYFFFVDDDYLVNVRLLLTDLRKKKLDKSIFTGNVWYKAKPNRNITEKWFVSKSEYPDEFWPPYAAGGSFALSYDYARRIKKRFETIKPLYIDDVYLGIVAKKLNIPLTNNGKFHPAYYIGAIHRLYSIHNFVSPRKLVKDWNNVKSKIGTNI